MITTSSTESTLKKLSTLLQSEKKLYYSRFGDGDFFIMLGMREKMHQHSPELANELREAFEIQDDKFIKAILHKYPVEDGMVDGMWKPMNTAQIEYCLKLLNVTSGHYESHVFIPYLSTFKPNLIIDFLDTHIRPKKKMLINCLQSEQEMVHLKQLLGDIDYFVEVPFRDAYYKIDEWFPKVLEHIDDVELCIPAAGMAGRVVQKRLFNMGYEIQSLDLGAILDAVCGRVTRAWIRMVTPERIRSNLKLDE